MRVPITLTAVLLAAAVATRVRALLEFFYLENQDVSASDYLAPGTWSNLRPDGATTLGEEPGRLYADLGRKLAHLSVNRGDKRGWDSGLWVGILKVARIWANALPPPFSERLVPPDA
jgi:hypothetical protein